MSMRVCLPPGGRAGAAESVRARLFVHGDSPRPLGGASTPRAGNRPARPAALPAVTLPPPLTPPARGAWQGERRRRHVTARPGARSPGGRRAGGRRAGGRAAGGQLLLAHRPGATAEASQPWGRGTRRPRASVPPQRSQPPPPSATPGTAGADGGPAPSAPPAERKCEGRAVPAAGWRCRRRKVSRRCKLCRARGGQGLGRRRQRGEREPQPGRGAPGTRRTAAAGSGGTGLVSGGAGSHSRTSSAVPVKLAAWPPAL